MVNELIFRDFDGVGYIDVNNPPPPNSELKTYPLGYQLFAFMDLDIDILAEKQHHIYWGLEDVKVSNPCDAKAAQERLKRLFSEIDITGAITIAEFEKACIQSGLEVPTHTVRAIDQYVCDYYVCMDSPGNLCPIVEQLAVAELHQIVSRGKMVKRCLNCGKLFIPSRVSEKYCIRISREHPNMTCKKVAEYKNRQAREERKPSLKLYHKVDAKLAKRAKDAKPKNQATANEQLFKFRDDAAALREKVKHGEATEQEYFAWLSTFDKKRKKNTVSNTGDE